MDERYDIFYAAGLLEDFDEATVRVNLAKLFKASDAALDKLFSGSPQPVKRGVDKAAAVKYKTAMNRAGAVAVIKKSAAVAAAPIAATPKAETNKPSPAVTVTKPQSMADRLAALTASGGTTADTMTLAPAGSEILNPDERITAPAPELDLSRLSVVADSELDSVPVVTAIKPDPEPQPLPEPVLESAPDTSHLSMGAVGEDIPLLAEAAAAMAPDVSHLSVGEVGDSIPNLTNPAVPLNPDTSAISLAPEGSEVLDRQYRRVASAAAPNTDHIQLEAAVAD